MGSGWHEAGVGCYESYLGCWFCTDTVNGSGYLLQLFAELR